MGWYEDHLEEKLDANGDLAPPWVMFPTYERYTIGWRMGSGESWLSYVHAFLQHELGPEPEARRAWLQRHRPAPFTWANWVLHVIGQDVDEIDQACLDALVVEGLIAPDAGYRCYLDETDRSPPWTWDGPPIEAARYGTRVLAFWCRSWHEGESGATAPTGAEVPEPWAEFVAILTRAREPALRPDDGLESLAQALAAGSPPAPWCLGLDVSSFADTYDDDMGYADAFRLWLSCAFDDRPSFEIYAATQPAPPDPWRAWLRGELHLPGDP